MSKSTIKFDKTFGVVAAMEIVKIYREKLKKYNISCSVHIFGNELDIVYKSIPKGTNIDRILKEAEQETYKYLEENDKL